MTNARFHLIVRGRVQGVGFRFFVVSTALSLGLTGWTRNRLDDSVEIEAEGDRAALESLLAQVRQGPPSSRVDDVEIQWESYSGEFRNFEVRRTG
ncbi:MAG: acylphosphatase [Anaerolineae bacterium]|nr:MAG: acylphosphatase [Anaerolineae bacterium]